MNKEVREFLRGLAKKHPGWYFAGRTGTGHLKLNYVPGGHIIIAATPSDYRWSANAVRDMDAVIAKSGPYIPTYTKKKDTSPGLTYKELLAQQENEVVEQPKALPMLEIPLPLAPKLEEPLPYKSIPKPKPKEYVMSTFDREIIIRIMQEKYDSLRVRLEPYLADIEEYLRIEKTLNELKRVAKPEAEKVAEFLAAKKSAPPKIEEVLPNTTKASALKVYTATEEIVKSHGGKMDIPEIIQWLREVKGYDFVKPGLTERTSFTQHIGQVNVCRKPEARTLIFGPKWIEGEKKSAYKWIEYRENDSDGLIRHYSNANK